jgi:hypothetical protein
MIRYHSDIKSLTLGKPRAIIEKRLPAGKAVAGSQSTARRDRLPVKTTAKRTKKAFQNAGAFIVH